MGLMSLAAIPCTGESLASLPRNRRKRKPFGVRGGGHSQGSKETRRTWIATYTRRGYSSLSAFYYADSLSSLFLFSFLFVLFFFFPLGPLPLKGRCKIMARDVADPSGLLTLRPFFLIFRSSSSYSLPFSTTHANTTT